jgi:hypothetical protein
LLEFIRADGLPDDLWDASDKPTKPKSQTPDDTIDDEDIPPRQTGLWE